MKKFYALIIISFMMGYTSSAQLVINEILYDPPSGIDGDANGDGLRDAAEDEFIEFFNTGATPLDVSGYMIYDVVLDVAGGTPTGRNLRHTVPAGTIVPAQGFLVIFGGGTPTGTFGGAVVVTDTGSAGLSLRNSEERIEIEDAAGNIVLTFDTDALSNNPDESYTRDPDITGSFVQHVGATGSNGTFFSPGTYIDGTPGATLSIISQTKEQLSVYPNPVTEGSITLENAPDGLKNISLYDLNGRLVFNQSTDISRLSVAGVSPGIYLIRVSVDERIQTQKLIIQ